VIETRGAPERPIRVSLPVTTWRPGSVDGWYGLSLAWPGTVLPPWYSTEAVLRTMARWPDLVPGGARVVDVGCGSGALGLHVAASAAPGAVVMTDVAPDAVRAATANLQRNGSTQGAVVVQGDALEWTPARPTFDVVIANLPFDPTPQPAAHDPWGPLATSLRDEGYRLHRRLLDGAAHRLRPSGRVVLAGSPTIGDESMLRCLVRRTGFRIRRSCTWWFATPRPRHPGAVNAYCVYELVPA
jgi:release factor glutamine methyltransferase